MEIMVLGIALKEEELKELEQPAKELSGEVTIVYALIRNYRARRRVSLLESEGSRLELITKTLTLIALAAIAVLLMALKFLPETTIDYSSEEIRQVLQIMVLSVYALGAITMRFQYVSAKSLFRNFTGKLIDTAEEVSKDDVALFKQLDSLSTKSIKFVTIRLKQIAEQLGTMRSFLLGAIDKVGIIPGLIAAIVAINKIPGGGAFSWVEGLSFALVGIYAAIFPMTSAAYKLKNLASVLDQYLIQERSQ